MDIKISNSSDGNENDSPTRAAVENPGMPCGMPAIGVNIPAVAPRIAAPSKPSVFHGERFGRGEEKIVSEACGQSSWGTNNSTLHSHARVETKRNDCSHARH